MRARHLARSEGHGARADGGDSQVGKGGTDPNDIGDRVERTHLVKRDALGRNAVDAALGRRQPCEDGLR